MHDPRQGPLPTWDDPFSTAAERCVAGILDRQVPSRPPFLTGEHPHVIAYPGYVGPRPAYYLAADGWRDTASNEKWIAP